MIVKKTDVIEQMLKEVDSDRLKITHFLNGEVIPENSIFSLDSPGVHEMKICWEVDPNREFHISVNFDAGVFKEGVDVALVKAISRRD